MLLGSYGIPLSPVRRPVFRRLGECGSNCEGGCILWLSLRGSPMAPRFRVCGKSGIWYNVTRKDNSHGYEMQTLRFNELRARLRIRPKPASRTSRRREALRMVRLVKLRTWVRIWPRQDSPAWSGKQQVHLVRLDIERIWLHILPDASAREMMAIPPEDYKGR